MEKDQETIVRELLFGGAQLLPSHEPDLGLIEPAPGVGLVFAEHNQESDEALVERLEISNIPTRLEELNQALTRVYDLSVKAALDLSIPIIGTVSGGESRRVVVLESKHWRDVEQPDSTAQYGYAIRLAITTNKLDANVKLNLAYLAASAQLGLIEASWTLYCIGLSGKPIDDATIPPKELSVETFVLAQLSLYAILKAAWEAGTSFSAVKISETKNTDQLRKEYYKDIARAYALGRIERGRTLTQAIEDLGSGNMSFADFVSDFYYAFVGIVNPTDAIPSQARQRAKAFLQTIDVVIRS